MGPTKAGLRPRRAERPPECACPGGPPPPCLRRRRRPPPRGKFGLFMCLARSRCAAVFLCPISSMLRCALAGRAQRQRPGGNLMRITLPHACGVTESPLSGQSKRLSLVQRSETSARIASTGRCGRLEDNHHATTLLPQRQRKSNSTFPHLAAGGWLAHSAFLMEDEATAPRGCQNFLQQKRASPGTPTR